MKSFQIKDYPEYDDVLKQIETAKDKCGKYDDMSMYDDLVSKSGFKVSRSYIERYFELLNREYYD
jgi:hypothetical protein